LRRCAPVGRGHDHIMALQGAGAACRQMVSALLAFPGCAACAPPTAIPVCEASPPPPSFLSLCSALLRLPSCSPQDKSWRVRYNVAAQMVPLCEALGPELTRAELVPAYARLLEDGEAEVRIAAAGKVSSFSRMLTPPLIVSQVVPRVKELANDSSQFVRAALAGVVMELAPQLGKAPTIEHLVPVFLNLLRDPYPDVRLNVISKLDQVCRLCRLAKLCGVCMCTCVCVYVV
jgi:HEAT repeat